jgi:hypothetical protein
MDSDARLGAVPKYCPKCSAAALRVVGAKLLRCEACGFELYMNPAAAHITASSSLPEQKRRLDALRRTGRDCGRQRVPPVGLLPRSVSCTSVLQWPAFSTRLSSVLSLPHAHTEILQEHCRVGCPHARTVPRRRGHRVASLTQRIVALLCPRGIFHD